MKLNAHKQCHVYTCIQSRTRMIKMKTDTLYVAMVVFKSVLHSQNHCFDYHSSMKRDYKDISIENLAPRKLATIR